MKISLLGTGWLGSALFAALLKDERYTLFASYRSPATRKKLRGLINTSFDYQETARPGSAGSGNSVIEAMQAGPPRHRLFKINVPDFTEHDLPFFSAKTMVITLPPGRRRANAEELYTSEIAAIIQRAEKTGVGHLIYTSSTGVYGNIEGSVDEATPTAPVTQSAKAVLAAEELFRAGRIPATILRLAGLYGPGRHPGRWFAGKEQIAYSEAPVNLVHQQDVVSAIKKVMAAGPPPTGKQVFNVCAATHPSKATFYGRAIEAYGGALPELLAGGANGKRIDSSKIRRQLRWQPAHDQLIVT
ncbi:hypothetical protein CEQ90_14925 [Lewinellaceae bacterium SD302]|nr:hypothetical protein CEQ90_14925 [Lewinellaceae bacterium SD302]